MVKKQMEVATKMVGIYKKYPLRKRGKIFSCMKCGKKTDRTTGFCLSCEKARKRRV
jgi:hypothetical protein